MIRCLSSLTMAIFLGAMAPPARADTPTHADAYVFSIGKAHDGIAGWVTPPIDPASCIVMAASLIETIKDGSTAGIQCGTINGEPSAAIFFGDTHTASGTGVLHMVGPPPHNHDGCYTADPDAPRGGTAHYVITTTMPSSPAPSPLCIRQGHLYIMGTLP